MSVLPPHPEQGEAREENHPSPNERALGSFQSLISFDNDLAPCWSRRSGKHVTYTASPTPSPESEKCSGLVDSQLFFSGFPTVFKELVKPCELQLENTSQ